MLPLAASHMYRITPEIRATHNNARKKTSSKMYPRASSIMPASNMTTASPRFCMDCMLQTNKQMDGLTNRQTDRQTNTTTDRQTDIDRQTNTDRETDRQTDAQCWKHYLQ